MSEILDSNSYFKYIEYYFPHVAQKIKSFWGTEFFYFYFNNLMNDTRNGTRDGFPKDAADSLMRLYKLHDNLFPEVEKRFRHSLEC